ncbi:hypothetical protein HQQ80_04730 [Microbacteriaceae bacterium VKM Ac-2855]|nr:hypothetical protein [Microbacteriaceae bacterium VKM Ac-2855]
MQLHVVLRLTPSENRKNRPDWYSKETCLRSLLTAIDTARARGVNVAFSVVVDVSSGRRLDPRVSRLLSRADGIQPIVGGTAAKSWRPVVRLVRDHVSFADDDLLYFIEDDYLHQPEALVDLVEGTADYRLLYVPEDAYYATGDEHDGWASVDTSTSSFALTGAAFREDAAMHLTFSHGGGAWDELCWRGIGSRVHPPAPLGYVVQPFTSASQWSRKWGLRPIRHAVFRAAALMHARFRSRTVELRLPMPATHGELALLASGTDWSELATRYTESSAAAAPELSVIVSVRNGSAAVLDALDALPTMPAAEILVFDERRTDTDDVWTPVSTKNPDVCVFHLIAPCHYDLVVALGTTIAQGAIITTTPPDELRATPAPRRVLEGAHDGRS